MKFLQKITVFLLCGILLLTPCLTARGAYSPQYTAQAETLYQLGLFKGTGTNPDGSPVFALEQPANRIQGLVMLIRLLGEESAALSYTGACPFTDVPLWAAPYAGYAFEKGYTKGVSATIFGADDPLLGKAYLTFVLRALGYDDTTGDFSYNDAAAFAASLGLISAGQCEGSIYRDDCALVSCNALQTGLKASSETLLDKLTASGVVTEDMLLTSGLVKNTVDVPYDFNKGKLDAKAVYAAIPNAVSILSYGMGGYDFSDVQWDSDATRTKLLLRSYPISEYVNGSIPQLPAISAKDNRPRLYNNPALNPDNANSYTIITALDADYHMVAYCIVQPGYTDNVLPFTLCSFGGVAMIEENKAHIQAIPAIDSSAFSKEIIRTVYADGTETSHSYLRIDESKLPASVQGKVAYYDTSSTDRSVEVLTFQEFTIFSRLEVSIYGEAGFQTKEQYSARDYLFLYDKEENLIAYAHIPNGFATVETLIQK